MLEVIDGLVSFTGAVVCAFAVAWGASEWTERRMESDEAAARVFWATFPAALVGLLVLLWAGAAAAHEAPSGWEYDARCCSDRDCQVLRFGAAVPTADGWRVRFDAGDHHYFEGALDVTIPYDDHRIQPSQDTEFHICVSKMGHVFCLLYVPPMGG